MLDDLKRMDPVIHRQKKAVYIFYTIQQSLMITRFTCDYDLLFTIIFHIYL